MHYQYILGLKASRCCSIVIINYSSQPIQLLNSIVREGKHIEFFNIQGIRRSALGFDKQSQIISPDGGVAVGLAYGHRPTIVDLAHVKVYIHSSAFNIQISTRPNGTTCEGLGGFKVGYIEKTLTEWWGKYVLLVS